MKKLWDGVGVGQGHTPAWNGGWSNYGKGQNPQEEERVQGKERD